MLPIIISGSQDTQVAKSKYKEFETTPTYRQLFNSLKVKSTESHPLVRIKQITLFMFLKIPTISEKLLSRTSGVQILTPFFVNCKSHHKTTSGTLTNNAKLYAYELEVGKTP